MPQSTASSSENSEINSQKALLDSFFEKHFSNDKAKKLRAALIKSEKEMNPGQMFMNVYNQGVQKQKQLIQGANEEGKIKILSMILMTKVEIKVAGHSRQFVVKKDHRVIKDKLFKKKNFFFTEKAYTDWEK
uniref:Uncharacterized protein n=1 Tax=Chromera velia CCMP2878 TaxID=1169474 RepID=A0A0G4H802_9ALVE|eukprot:Cvel_25093.t1-p1 / transcript=Cvel_25093.t1 / gene=Cvel_25093 / organism=Chromera_velia_CCMP2878 / gene_product=hypothetical protein / transcript_product=hypothetical protein / location=Cvel_scaffold2797:6313-7025(-) / protein_length=131 / sequence_SO=supercontig / SO=protein_coding / is_pseudo=false